MGELRQRGRIWWIRYYRNGRRYEESSGSRKKGVAVDLLKIREGDGVKGLPVTPKSFRFDEAFEYVVNDYRAKNRKTIADVERRIHLHLKPFFGGRRMADVSTDQILKFTVQRQGAGASNAEINRELAIVKRAYKLALKAKKLFLMPGIDLLGEDNTRQGFFERDQFEAVRAALPEPLRPVVTLGYLTGWRIRSEILPLQWRHVDRVAGVFRLEPGTTKNKRGRTFPYRDMPELRDWVEAQWQTHEELQGRGIVSPWVFPRLRGEDPGGRIGSFRKAWKTACEVAGCPGRIPHDFRRTAVRNLVRANVSDTTAMKLTGHETRSVFDRYAIVDEADLADGVRKLAEKGTEKGQFGQSGVVRQIRHSKKLL